MCRARSRWSSALVVERLDRRDVPATVTWTGAGGTPNWALGANWDSGDVPQPGDDVIIGPVPLVVFDAAAGSVNLNTLTVNSPFTITGGSLTMSQSASFAQPVTQSGGTLGGPGLMTFTSGLSMTGGKHTGPGQTQFTTGSTWSIDTNNTSVFLTGREFTVFGQVAWTGALPALTADGSLTIAAGGSFASSATGSWEFDTSASGASAATPIQVATGATFTASAPTTFNSTVNLDGTGVVNAVVAFASGTWSGTVSGTGKVVLPSQTLTLQGAPSVTPAGGVQVTGGTLLIPTATDSATVSKLTQSGGVVAGQGQLTINAAWAWTGGAMTGTGRTVLNGTATATLDTTSSNLSLAGRAVVNNGAVTLVGAGSVFAGGSNWTNKPGAKFEIIGDGKWQDTPTTGGTFINEINATLRRASGTGSATFGTTVFNSGSVVVETGTLDFAGGLNGAPSSLGSGTYVLTGTLRAPGLSVATNTADLTINGPDAALINSTTNNNVLPGLANNPGKFTVTGGAVVNLANPLATSGVFVIDKSARVNVGGAVTQTGGVTVLDGELDPAGAPGKLSLAAGVLRGNGELLGNLIVTGGTVSPGNSAGRIKVVGDFDSGGAFVVELNGPLPALGYDQVAATNSVTLSGPLSVSRGFDPGVGAEFRIIDNQSASSVSGTFAGLAEGATFNVSGMRFRISYVGGDGNDVTLTRLATGIASIQPGAPGQCSVVREITVTFTGLVTLPGSPATAFDLQKTNGSPTGAVNIAVTATDSVTETTAKITFPGGAFTDLGGLADGKYVLTVFGGLITDPSGAQLDGANTNTPGSNGVANFQRLFGDIDCDGDVDGADFLQFRLSFLSNNPGFDIDGDGDVDSFEFLRFRLNFLQTLPP